MATMNISLPQEMKTWVESQTEGGRYANSSDVVRDLVRRAIRREEAIAEMNALVDEGLKSGIVENYDPVERRRRLRVMLEAEQRKSA